MAYQNKQKHKQKLGEINMLRQAENKYLNKYQRILINFGSLNINIFTRSYHNFFTIRSESLDSSAVERQPFKLVVEGSIPSWGAFFLLFPFKQTALFIIKYSLFKNKSSFIIFLL